MTSTFIKTVAATTAALVFGATSLVTPAMAGGQFSFSFAPQSSDQQQVLGLGLLVLSLVNGASASGANVQQHGNNNGAG